MFSSQSIEKAQQLARALLSSPGEVRIEAFNESAKRAWVFNRETKEWEEAAPGSR